MITGAVTGGRQLAARLMVDSGRISRPSTDPPTLDLDTGISSPPAPTVIHEGPCRVKARASLEQDAVSGDANVTAVRFVINWPHDIPDIHVDDIIEIVTSDDPHIADRTFRVTSVPSKTFLIHRQIGAEVIE